MFNSYLVFDFYLLKLVFVFSLFLYKQVLRFFTNYLSSHWHSKNKFLKTFRISLRNGGLNKETNKQEYCLYTYFSNPSNSYQTVRCNESFLILEV